MAMTHVPAWMALATLGLALSPLAPADDGPTPSPEATSARWGIAPVTSEAGGERTEFAATLEPGASWVDSVAITNLSPIPLEFDLYGADGIITDDGDPAIVDRGSPATGLGAWIGFNERHVEVPANSALGVPLRVTVPSDALPGDHCGGVVASLSQSEGVAISQPNLVVDARTAVWMCVSVPGEVDPRLGLADVTAAYRPGLAGFGPGTVEVAGEIVNSGNIRLAASVEVTVTGPFGWWSTRSAPTEIDDILPGQTLAFTTTVEDVPPWARIGSDITLTPKAREGVPQAPPDRTSSALWAAPWTAVTALVALGLLIWWLLGTRRRRRRRIDRAVAAALAARDTNGTPTSRRPSDALDTPAPPTRDTRAVPAPSPPDVSGATGPAPPPGTGSSR
ncbi:MAG: hypothetical protein LBK72_09610 [Bifidobacteriaceae bacterium]|jgi:hypothetical protein|nr:hypothetical protein [Bifidobacteriaceae bacterium]